MTVQTCQFNMDTLIFMGMLLSRKSISTTADRVRAVAVAQEPENAPEGHSFSYSRWFYPTISFWARAEASVLSA